MRIINQKVSRPIAFLMAAIPFVLILAVYMTASHYRLEANPADKLLPALESMGQAFWNMAAVPNRRTGEILLWKDTSASFTRSAYAMGISAAWPCSWAF